MELSAFERLRQVESIVGSMDRLKPRIDVRRIQNEVINAVGKLQLVANFVGNIKNEITIMMKVFLILVVNVVFLCSCSKDLSSNHSSSDTKKNREEFKFNAIMEEVKPGAVKNQRGWSHYIEVNNNVIWMIGLNANSQTNEDWTIRLEFYPGDTVNQARDFYKQVEMQKLLALGKNSHWFVGPNLHFAHMQRHLHWATASLPIIEYLEYWSKHQDKIAQYKKIDGGFQAVISWLTSEHLIGKVDVEAIRKHFVETNRNSINVNPGIKMIYTWMKDEAIELDDKGVFAEEATRVIESALSSWGEKLC